MPAYRPKCLTCERSRKASQLMCPRCWAYVPADLQNEIYRTWTAGSIRQSDEWAAAVQRAEAIVRAALVPLPIEES